jgi:hypothetical protein
VRTNLDPREAVTMLGLTRYRLRERLPAADVYEFLDRESGGLVGVAGPGEGKTAGKGPSRAILDVLLSFRLSRYCVTAVALAVSLFLSGGAILGYGRSNPEGRDHA